MGVSAGGMLFALTLFVVAMVFLPALGAQLDSATQPGPSWTPPPPTSIPSSTSSPTPTPPPTATTANSSPTAQTTPTSAPSSFQVGDVVRNVNKGVVNLRQTPGYLNKPSSDRIGLVSSGEQLLVIGGPEQKDKLIWWQVQWKDKNGWMAERTASGVLILQLAE